MNKSFSFPILSASLLFPLFFLFSCKKNEPQKNGNLVFKFRFDENQARLDNFGNPVAVGTGNAAQTPDFHAISAHYIEMIPNSLTLLGEGEILYQGAETTAGGDAAVNWNAARVVGEDDIFLSLPLKEINPGSYQYIRVSVTYQNYDIDFMAQGLSLSGSLASFVGFNTYIEKHIVKIQEVVVNANKLQGYWAFETGAPFPSLTEGQAPSGATTVPNPLSATSPIPAGSCLVTGDFDSPLTIVGNETEDIVVILSVSVNNSFEWSDPDNNGTYDPLDGDVPVDMGLRGLKAFVE